MRSTGYWNTGECTLRYACAETSVGRLLVVLSEHGVVDVILGDTHEEMLSRALKHFPGAGLFPDRGLHASWVAAVVKRVELPAAVPEVVPLDLDFDCRCRAAV